MSVFRDGAWRWTDEEQELCAWFLQEHAAGGLPMDEFDLHPQPTDQTQGGRLWGLVHLNLFGHIYSPERWYRGLEIEVRVQGPEGERARCGTLSEDLKQLRQILKQLRQIAAAPAKRRQRKSACGVKR